MKELKTVGDTIRSVRKDKKMTQIALAKASGLAVNSIRLYESGKHNPKMDSLKKLADALDVDVIDLMPNAKRASITRREIENKLGFDPYAGSNGQLVDVDADVFMEMISDIDEAYKDHPEDKPFDLKIFSVDLDNPGSPRDQLLDYFDKMNLAGQKCAVESVKLLSEQSAFIQIPKKVNVDHPDEDD